MSKYIPPDRIFLSMVPGNSPGHSHCFANMIFHSRFGKSDTEYIRADLFQWQPIETAPKNKRVLVRHDGSNVYAAHWVKNPEDGDEAWKILQFGEDQYLIKPTHWMPMPEPYQEPSNQSTK